MRSAGEKGNSAKKKQKLRKIG